MELFSTAILLFLIMDPLGNIPIFLAVLKDVPPARRAIVLRRELWIAYGIMCLFLLSGAAVLKSLGLSREAVGIGGAIVLFIIALRMIFPSRGGVMGDEEISGEPLIVPLAIPLVAGPSLLATLILLTENAPSHFWTNYFAMTLAWLVSAVILLSAPFLFRILGHRGLKAIERLMGMILICLAVQMMLNALSSLQI